MTKGEYNIIQFRICIVGQYIPYMTDAEIRGAVFMGFSPADIEEWKRRERKVTSERDAIFGRAYSKMRQRRKDNEHAR